MEINKIINRVNTPGRKVNMKSQLLEALLPNIIFIDYQSVMYKMQIPTDVSDTPNIDLDLQQYWRRSV